MHGNMLTCSNLFKLQKNIDIQIIDFSHVLQRDVMVVIYKFNSNFTESSGFP